jgi:arabinan endo-1,5-alpha-L-arabinosidase
MSGAASEQRIHPATSGVRRGRAFLVVAALLLGGAGTLWPASWSLSGDLGAHDPSIIREGGTWWCFATGTGLPVKNSADGLSWTQRTPLFAAELSWWRTYAPNMASLDVWAPDVHRFGSRTWCYYCVSEFGQNNSAIGLLSCTSIAAGDWRDDGVVISSRAGVDAFNAIDPSLTTDAAGNPWLVFGSWFDGLHVVQLDPNTMKPTGTIYSIAVRSNGIEGANIVYANGYYYLFASIDRCCLGVNSTYKIAYGRSAGMTGPYLDKDTVPMVSGGGTVLDAGDSRWIGPGGQSVVQNGGAWVMAFHAYDANNNGNPTLLISDLFWDSANWPTMTGPGVTVRTLAGQAGSPGSADGTGTAARFNFPADVAADSTGNLYVADTDNHTIRGIAPSTGAVTTLAGLAGAAGSADGAGVAARFNHPAGVTADAAANVYVADTDNDTIRKLTPAGVVSTLAGTAGAAGSADGSGGAVRFNGPSGIAADTAGSLYVADTLNLTVRKITPAGAVSIVAGMAGVSGSADGVGSAARFAGPQGVALDGTGNLFVADTNNDTIRRIVPATGAVTTGAGQAGASGATDGAATQARFFNPSGVAADSAGNLFVADTDNSTIREITPAGAVVTIAGQPDTTGSADGVDGAARFNFPTGIAVDNSGNVYVADTNNHAIRVVTFPVAPRITTQPQSQTVTAGANVQFSVTATGQPAPTYQWVFNGTAISGATGSSYSLTNVQSSSAGDYTVAVSNSAGSVTSGKATLTVNAATTPPASSGGGGGGGGGAMPAWFAAGLALLGAARWLRPGAKEWRALAWLFLPAAALLAQPAAPPPDGDALLARLGRREARVHDPSTIVKCKDEYWVFATGRGVSSLHSKDLVQWERGPVVFPQPPAWITQVVPTQKGYFWAPDVLWHDGCYLLYYAVSAFGKRTSAIALATNPTLDPADPAYHWTDRGVVIQTSERDDFNAIDPSVFHDTDGKLWLAFGSFWRGIKLIELDPATGLRLAPDSPIHPLAWHESIEAACLYRHGDFYYLFVNWGLCCRGVKSTYEIRVGRSTKITGPYLDRDGRDLLHDGGSVFMATDGPFIGPGHVGILAEGGRFWVSVHFYDGTRNGAPTLAIRPLIWSADGWPEAAETP